MIHLISQMNEFMMHSPYPVSSLILIKDGYYCLYQAFISEGNKIFFPYFKIIRRTGQFHGFEKVGQSISFGSEFLDDGCFFALRRAVAFCSLKAISFLLPHSPS